MKSNTYRFLTRWQVTSTAEEISGILGNAPDLPRWWPSVYLAVQELAPGDARGIGKVVSLYAKGWLPYILRWQFRATKSDYPHGFELTAWATSSVSASGLSGRTARRLTSATCGK